MSFNMLLNKGFRTPLVGGIVNSIKCNLYYIQIEEASCSGNRRVTQFYKVYCKTYGSRSGCMPRIGGSNASYKMYCRI